MGEAKRIQVRIIGSSIANDFVKKHHYSGKMVNNSVLHFGCYLQGVLGGVMSFGNPIDKRKVLGLVETSNKDYNAKWNEMLELNRMAFSALLPKNSESRCLGIALRTIRKEAPQIKWVLSFADATQCGDGTIYRASGFKLANIKKNQTIKVLPNGAIAVAHGTSTKDFTGAKKLEGFQITYIYLIDKTAIITNELPFSAIKNAGAEMYKGKKIVRAPRTTDSTPSTPVGDTGSNPSGAHKE